MYLPFLSCCKDVSCLFLFQMFVSRLTAYFRRKCVSATDERVQKMNEVLNYIKFIKMYAWVKAFSQNVQSECRHSVNTSPFSRTHHPAPSCWILPAHFSRCYCVAGMLYQPFIPLTSCCSCSQWAGLAISVPKPF